jgi:steroid delta-isomerase-like uncharacterized protein
VGGLTFKNRFFIYKEKTMSTESMIRSLYDAFNSRNFDQGATLLTPDVCWQDVATGRQFEGHEGYKQFMGSWSGAFPDAQVEVSNVVVSNGYATAEFHGRGTHTGPLQTPAGAIPPTGRRVDIPFCEVLELKDGRIASARTYFDSATMLRQLGLIS